MRSIGLQSHRSVSNCMQIWVCTLGKALGTLVHSSHGRARTAHCRALRQAHTQESVCPAASGFVEALLGSLRHECVKAAGARTPHPRSGVKIACSPEVCLLPLRLAREQA